MSNQTKAEEIVLLEKQGLCSQKLRNNMTGNLAQVTHTVGQNMTDISNIGSNNLKKVERFTQTFFYLYKISKNKKTNYLKSIQFCVAHLKMLNSDIKFHMN